MANSGTGWFPGSSDAPRSEAGRIEDAACRTALRQVGVSAGAVSRAAGLPPTGKLTFAHLAELADFPARPAVTDVVPDPILELLYRFSKSRLWSAWVYTEATSAMPRGQHVLVFRGVDWKLGVMYPQTERLVTRSHLLVGVEHGVRMVVERFLPWCQAVEWRGGDFERIAGGGGSADE